MRPTRRQIELVQNSFAKLRDELQPRSVEFYTRMFTRKPSLRSLFRTDIREQGMRFMSALSLIVEELENPDAMWNYYSTLAEEHALKGVTAEDFRTMGEALIETLRANLGEDFDDETEEAWIVAYNATASAMIELGSIR